MPGERAVVKVRLDANLFPEDTEELPLINDKLLVENQKYQVLDQSLEKEGDFWVWRYEITAYQVGSITLPPVEVRVEGENYSTEAVSIPVVSTRAEGDQSLHPEFGILGVPFQWKSILKLLGMVIGAALGVLLLAYAKSKLKLLVRRFRKPAPVAPVHVAPAEDPKVWLRRELQLLRNQVRAGIPTEDSSVDAFTLIVREYYARKYSLPVKSFTSHEFLKRLPTDDTAKPIAKLFDACDEFKYCPEHPGNEVDLTLSSIERSEKILLC